MAAGPEYTSPINAPVWRKNAPRREFPFDLRIGDTAPATGPRALQGHSRAWLRGRGLPHRPGRRPAGGEPARLRQLERDGPAGDGAARDRAEARPAGAVRALRRAAAEPRVPPVRG